MSLLYIHTVVAELHCIFIVGATLIHIFVLVLKSYNRTISSMYIHHKECKGFTNKIT